MTKYREILRLYTKESASVALLPAVNAHAIPYLRFRLDDEEQVNRIGDGPWCEYVNSPLDVV